MEFIRKKCPSQRFSFVKKQARTDGRKIYRPFCNLNISKLVVFVTGTRHAQCDRRGAPLGKWQSPVPKCSPLLLPTQEATPHFWLAR